MTSGCPGLLHYCHTEWQQETRGKAANIPGIHFLELPCCWTQKGRKSHEVQDHPVQPYQCEPHLVLLETYPVSWFHGRNKVAFEESPMWHCQNIQHQTGRGVRCWTPSFPLGSPHGWRTSDVSCTPPPWAAKLSKIATCTKMAACKPFMLCGANLPSSS